MKSKIYNKERRLNNIYRIVDKEGKSVKFVMNKMQKELFEYQKIHNRVIILKSRQLGASTYKIIEGLDRALFAKNQTVIITAHKLDKMKELFEKAKYAYESLPEQIQLRDGKIRNKPKAHYNSANELFFKESNSRIRVSLDSRSGTPTSLHITELAFMDRAKEMWTGSMPSIPKDAPITVETTANGIGNFFYNLWNKYNNKTDGEFKTLFFPWYDDTGYTLEKDMGELPAELEHLKKFNLTKGQLNWYINQYDILGREVFQEMPTEPSEAFLTTGNPFFNINILKQLPNLEYKQDLKYNDLRIYGEPCNNCIYGVDTSGGGIDGDLSVITVRDKQLNLKACYMGRTPPDELANIVQYIYNLGYKTYGETIGVEINNTGISTIDKLKNTNLLNYLYGQKVLDERTQKKTKKLGFNTNLKTRPLILSDLEEAIRKGLLVQLDERAKEDFMHFIYNDNGRPEALEGKHDDGVMAEAICLFMTNQTQNMWV